MTDLARRVYLVRHGATGANLKQPYVLQGQRTDMPLAELGCRQASAAAQALADRPITLAFSSPLRRACETADILAAHHGFTVRSVPEFTECDVGRWEGLSWQTIRAQDRDAWAAFDAAPGLVPYAGGESFQHVQDRAVPALGRLLFQHQAGDILVVTHNVVARVILAHVMGIAINNARRIRVDNGSISIIEAARGDWKLVTLNSIFHLNGLVST